MESWFSLETLIWLFPIIFVFHDFEEIIMMEKWLKLNTAKLNERLPQKWADRVSEQFSMTTAQFSAAVLIIFLVVSSSTFMASQYIQNGPLGNIYFFTSVVLVFFIHVFTHIGQSIYLRSITPGVVTSIFLVLPYSFVMLKTLLELHLINWNTLLLALPFGLLMIPTVLFAHWVGKKVV